MASMTLSNRSTSFLLGMISLELRKAPFRQRPMPLGAHRHGAVPTPLSRAGCSRQFGRASAPMIPHRVHTMRGPKHWHVIRPRVRAHDRPVVALPAAHVERPHAVGAHVATAKRRQAAAPAGRPAKPATAKPAKPAKPKRLSRAAAAEAERLEAVAADAMRQLNAMRGLSYAGVLRPFKPLK
jgi:hypothetical protein